MSLNNLIKLSFFVLCLFFSHLSVAQYWAKLEVSELLKFNRIYVKNLTDKPIRCDIRAFNDRVFMEIDGSLSSPKIILSKQNPFPLHQLHLTCQPINAITHKNVWRVNVYQNGSAHVHHTVFLSTEDN